MENEQEVIDLTESFTYCRGPIRLSYSVIDLDDSIDSDVPSTPIVTPAEPIVIECETEALPAVNISKKSKKANKKKGPSKTSNSSASSERERSPHQRDCPICRDPLGTRPMASTKCGHVYCNTCIEQAVRFEKKCPTCRKPLKGKAAYHPLYL